MSKVSEKSEILKTANFCYTSMIVLTQLALSMYNLITKLTPTSGIIGVAHKK